MEAKFEDNGFKSFLENIKPSKLKSALKSGLRKSLNIIKKKATENLRGVTKAYKKPDKWGLTLQGGIIVKVKKDGLGGRAEIIAKHKKYNFKLKFFENGTVGRQTRKGYNRGKMTATHFFSTAADSSKADVHASLEKNLDESLQKAFKKYAGKQ